MVVKQAPTQFLYLTPDTARTWVRMSGELFRAARQTQYETTTDQAVSLAYVSWAQKGTVYVDIPKGSRVVYSSAIGTPDHCSIYTERCVAILTIEQDKSVRVRL